MYTLKDHEVAKPELAELNKTWGNYSRNNPNKFQTRIREARAKVRAIERTLKSVGVIPRTDQEELEHPIDLVFPNAKSKHVVEFNGKNHIRRFTPLGKSLSAKTVTEWGKSWEEATE